MCLCCKVGTVCITATHKGSIISTAECLEVSERVGSVLEEYTESEGRTGKIKADVILLGP